MKPSDVILPQHLAQALLVIARTAAEVTPSCRTIVSALADRIQAAKLAEAEAAKLPPQARLGALVTLATDIAERPRNRWAIGTVVGTYPAVEHEHDCYVLVRWGWEDLMGQGHAGDALVYAGDLTVVP